MDGMDGMDRMDGMDGMDWQALPMTGLGSDKNSEIQKKEIRWLQKRWQMRMEEVQGAGWGAGCQEQAAA